ncbi:hypothetical protein [Pantoea cypripedii]|uniref:hypothetical protein n=1 Tax=Pantoea cypripedii TaxID=55209 RepID=UPI001AC0090F|nr:hypothetical protein [Pantoea cypripedii]
MASFPISYFTIDRAPAFEFGGGLINIIDSHTDMVPAMKPKTVFELQPTLANHSSGTCCELNLETVVVLRSKEGPRQAGTLSLPGQSKVEHLLDTKPTRTEDLACERQCDCPASTPAGLRGLQVDRTTACVNPIDDIEYMLSSITSRGQGERALTPL